MAQLGVAGGGAALGAALGSVIPGVGTLLGAQVGWALGGVAGALLFPQKQPDQTGPRLTDLSVQISSYGAGIPLAFGTVRLAGNMIWTSGLREIATSRRLRGKGGGGPRSTTYSYRASWAIGLCEGPATTLLRIWFNDKLVYDVTGTNDLVQLPGLVFRFYPGNEAQLPDPAIAAHVGSDAAPAHRGLCYLVFDDVPLDNLGNRIPNVLVELAVEAERSFPTLLGQEPATPLYPSTSFNPAHGHLAVDYARGLVFEGRYRTATGMAGDDHLIRVYDAATLETRREQTMAAIVGGRFGPGEVPGGRTAIPAILHAGVDGFLYVANANAFYRTPIWKVDADRLVAVDHYGPAAGTFDLGGTENGAGARMPRTLSTVEAGDRAFLAYATIFNPCVIVAADTMDYVWGADALGPLSPAAPALRWSINPTIANVLNVAGARRDGEADLWCIQSSLGAAGPALDLTRISISAGALHLGAGASAGIAVGPRQSIDIVADVDPLGTWAELLQAAWDEADATLLLTIRTRSGAQPRYCTLKWSPEAGIVWAVVDHAWAISSALGQNHRLGGGTWGCPDNLVLETATGQVLVSQPTSTAFEARGYDSLARAAYGLQGGTVAKRFLDRQASSSPTLGTVVERLCARAGLDPLTDLDVSALTAPVRGYVLPRPTSARDAITPLAAAWQFDAAEVDDVLVFRPRGGAVVASLAYADLVRENPDAGVLQEQRAQDQELPRALTVRHMDPARAHDIGTQRWARPAAPVPVTGSLRADAMDLPLVLTADEAKTIARRLLTATWRERTRLTFAVGPRHARLVPTDPVVLGFRDGSTVRARLLSTQLGANWVTRCEAVTEEAAAYALTATADTGAGRPLDSMPLPYAVRALFPDLPLLEDADDLGGAGLREYILAGGYAWQPWRGATPHVSADGSAWQPLGFLRAAMEWGTLEEAPPLPATPHTWDEAGSLLVRMLNGAPEPATALEVLNGANLAALVGADGTAEVLQFRDVAALGEDRYRLSGLLRGRRGTEDLIASRAAGDILVLLDDSVALQVQTPLADLTRSLFHRAPTIYEAVQAAPTTWQKATRGRAERPYAPCHLAGSRDGAGNLTLTWIRRTRLHGAWRDLLGTVPLGEDAEAYEVDVLNGGGVVRTLGGLTSPTATYTAAQQVADFGAPQPAVAVRVHQLSGSVGRGVAAEAIL